MSDDCQRENLTRQQVIERLCLLLGEVHAAMCCQTASDCFCGEGGFWDIPTYREKDYRNEGVVLAWVERVVREAIPGIVPDPRAAALHALMSAPLFPTSENEPDADSRGAP